VSVIDKTKHNNMKKLILILMSILSGCGCIIGQIPPQYIYAGADCQASLPNYLLRVTAIDNCTIANLVQTPAPNYLLTATNLITDVVIRATDNSGNFREMKFTVTLIDTIKPIFVVDTTLFGYNAAKMTEFYDLADSYVEKITDSVLFKKWLFVISHKDNLGFRERLITFIDTLKFPLE
jgi:hypothetical protein